MHIIITHSSPDWDAITSVWILRRFLPGWKDAKVEFVAAGERSTRVVKKKKEADTNEIVVSGDDKIIHVDTGLTPLDHHQTKSNMVCAASKCWEYVQKIENSEWKIESERMLQKKEAIDRIIDYMVELDHFQEIYWDNPSANVYEFGPYGTLQGLKMLEPNKDEFYVAWGMEYLDAQLLNFENRIWAEKEIQNTGIQFDTRFGKALGLENLNDSVIKLAQKMGYVLVLRKDPRKGYVRIKTLPDPQEKYKDKSNVSIDLTLAYEKLSKMDPEATWFLHVGRKMLLNGSPKNPKMRPTKLSLKEIIAVLEKI